MSFDPTFNIGHIITVVSIITSAMMFAGATRFELKAMRVLLESHAVRLREIEDEQHKQTEILVTVARQDERLQAHDRRIEDIERRNRP
jgi:hypothetical protein